MTMSHVDKLFDFVDNLELSEDDKNRLAVLIGFACGEERKEGYNEGYEEAEKKLKK